MKKFVLLFALLPLASLSQTVTSVAAGNFYAPTTWDCTCIPNDSDTIYVNHTVTLDFGITYSGGLMQIGGAGSLVDAGSGNGIFIDGGTVMNIGTINVAAVLLETGGSVNNVGQFLVDSLWTRDVMDNMGIVDVYVNFWNDEPGIFTNNGTVTVMNDCLNEGIFNNNSDMYVHHDFANCNTTTSNATYDVGGLLCVYNDFINCTSDTVRGNGTIRIKGASNNAGEMEGNFIVNTPSGALTINTGTVAAGVSFAVGTCEVGLEENTADWKIYPNPTADLLTCSIGEMRFQIYDLSGKQVFDSTKETTTVSIGHLESGIYAVRLIRSDGYTATRLIKKN